MRQHHGLDFDAVRERTTLDEILAAKRSTQRRLPDIAFTDQQHLRLILGNAISQAAKIDSHRTGTLLDQLRQRLCSGLPSSCKIKPSIELISDLGGQRGQLIAVEVQVCRLVSWAISGGSAVSWLPSSFRVCRLVSWPISGGSAVS